MSAKQAQAKIDALNVEVCSLRQKISVAEHLLQQTRDQSHAVIKHLASAVHNLSERGGK